MLADRSTAFGACLHAARPVPLSLSSDMSSPAPIHELPATSSATPEAQAAHRKPSLSASSFSNEKQQVDPEVVIAKELAKDSEEVEAARERRRAVYTRLRPFILIGLIVLIGGWWISATVLPATRHRWCVSLLHLSGGT